MFKTGNVIRDYYGNLLIVVDVREDHLNYLFVNFSNASGGMSLKNHEEEDTCNCGYVGCEQCDEGKRVFKTVHGAEDAVLVADNIKDWILDNLTTRFGFHAKNNR